MTIEEKIKEAESLIAKANKLLEEVKEEKENKETNILVDYYNALQNEAYWIDACGTISWDDSFTYQDIISEDNMYGNYPSQNYAEQAKKIKEFNDKLLAFKWCYDRDYIPVFSDDYDSPAYFIYYDSEDNEYDYEWDGICNRNVIYFSSDAIAKKCCDWLNSLEEENNNG